MNIKVHFNGDFRSKKSFTYTGYSPHPIGHFREDLKRVQICKWCRDSNPSRNCSGKRNERPYLADSAQVGRDHTHLKPTRLRPAHSKLSHFNPHFCEGNVQEPSQPCQHGGHLTSICTWRSPVRIRPELNFNGFQHISLRRQLHDKLAEGSWDDDTKNPFWLAASLIIANRTN